MSKCSAVLFCHLQGCIYLLVRHNKFMLHSLQSISDDSVDLGGTSRTSELDSLGKVLQNPAHTTGPSLSWWNEDEETLNGGM